MDGRQFDDLLRSLSDNRRSLLGVVLGATVSLLGLPNAEAKGKKKKRKCAKKCPQGCCTSKYGKCIQPVEQSGTQCGTGGEICRSNCDGGVTCGGGCGTCCRDGECVSEDEMGSELCGTGGETCFACGPKQLCNYPREGCCTGNGEPCGGNVTCCQIGAACKSGKCCVENGGFCSSSNECCDGKDVCEEGLCLRKRGETCANFPLTLLCVTPLSCSSFGICCARNGGTCEINADCCEDEDICDGGFCKRKHREFCEDGIICEDAYPFCEGERCLRCQMPEIETGTSEVCCRFNFSCDAANDGAGACCENEHCCLPNPEGGGVCLETEYGTPSC